MGKVTKWIKSLLLRDLWSRELILALSTTFLTFAVFDIIWCAGTTFRAFSDLGLYVNTIVASLILTLPYVFTRRLWVQAIVLFLLDGLLVSNLMYSRTYYTAIPLESYMLAGNLADFTASVVDSLSLVDLILPPLTVAMLVIGRNGLRPSTTIAGIIVRYLTIILIALIISGVTVMSRGGFYNHYDDMAQSCYYSTCGVPIYTVFGHMRYNYLDVTKSISPERNAAIARWLADKERLCPYKALPDSVVSPRNLVVILCESLESWVIDKAVEGKEITPFLNSLLTEEATLYASKVLTQVGNGRSIDCQLLFNAGMLPMLNSVYSMKHHDNQYHTLTKALKKKYGSRAYLLTCDKPIVWNQELIARSFGVDTLLDRSSWRNDELVGSPAKLSDGAFMTQSVEKLKAGEIWPEGEPAFVQWVTYSGHNPFRLPENLKRIKFDNDYPKRMVDYMTMANYTDYALSILIKYLKTRSDYDDTMIVIMGDHEALASGRESILQSPNARGIVSDGQYTPFIVLNSPIAGRYDEVMGQIDLYPTILNLMHLDDYEWKGMGQSILAPDNIHVAVSPVGNEIVGDTLNVSAQVLNNMIEARTISDAMIASDYFKTLQQ